MTAMHSLTVLLLCHDRTQLALEAIQSILNQTESGFAFIVSDNSSTTELKLRLAADFPQVSSISWYPGIPLADHFNRVISLVKTKYFVMFHDDDIMEPQYVERVMEQFRITPQAAAVGTNAYTIDGSGKRLVPDMLFSWEGGTRMLSDKKEFVMQYLVADRGGAPPLGSYAYNREFIEGISFDFSKGKFCDTIFLAETIERGPMLWINEPLIGCRVHQGRVSYSCGVRDYKPFLKWVRKEFDRTISDRYLDEYRAFNLLFILKKRRRLPISALKLFIRVFSQLILRSPRFRKRYARKLLARAVGRRSS